MIFKRFFLISVILLSRIVVDAQYADLGTGTLKNTIWWLNWSGFSISDGASKTFTTNDGLTVTITFSNVSGPIPYPDIMNTWVGAVLPTLYDFSDPTIQPAFYYYQPGPTYTSKFTLNISASRNGVPTPFSFVAADAEASLVNEESIDLTTDGSNWNILDFFRNSTQTTNPVQGCNTKSITITDTWNGNTALPIGQNPLMGTDASVNGNLNVNVTLDEEAPTSGGMGIAFGIFEPVDRGDLPASYGYAQHELTYQRNNSCNYLAPLPSLTQSQSLKLGAIAGDPDPIQYTDDNAYDLADEDALSAFPNYDGSGTYTLNIPLVNTTGGNVYLTGWFDNNRNGIFDNGESVTVTVPNNSTSATLLWQGLPNILPNGSVTNFGFRFRLSSDLAATQSPTGFAKDGEVEDYLVQINPSPLSLCTGSLGDPVVYITFGSGANPGQSLPAIVPGASTTLTYVAVTGNPATPTPIDGQYTITNNVPSNPSWFSGATDHTSGNGTGYMAFYNSSELSGEFYHQTVSNLCGSTTYEFAAWIANALNPAITIGVNPNVTFSIEQTDGTILASYNTNDIPQTANFTWNQYGFYFTTPANISTVVLRMVNNAPGGNANIGNDFAIDDITFRACGPITTASFNQNSPVDTLKVCADSSLTIYGTVSTGYNSPNYLWQVSVDSGKTWTDIPNSNALQIPITSQANQNTKQYTYRLMTAEGNNINSPNCRVASNMTVLFVSASPQGKLLGNTICNGDNTTLIFTETSGSSPFNIIYNVGANIYNQSNLNNNATFPVPYQLTDTTTFNLFSIADANGCIDTINATAVINVNPIPQGGITANTVCSGDSATIIFTASSGNAPFEIQLSDGTNTTAYYQVQSGKSFNILPLSNSETIYLVSITDQNGNGCSRINGFTYPSALVTVIPSPQVQFDSVPPICIDQPSFLINEAKEITGSSGSGIFSGQGSDLNGNFSPSIAGVGNHIITYTYKSLNGCADSASRDVVVNPLPVVNAGADIVTCTGFPVRLNVTGATTYTWLPILGLDDPTKSNPIATLDTTTTFIVQGTDPTGCFAYDTVTVNVSTKGIAAFQVPNAFTPNGDGLNDCFGIHNWGSDITVQEFTIYNRWGQLIFSTKNPSDCWDGTFKGAKQNSGGYPYIIKATSPCGNITRTGIVMLIR